MPLSYSKSAIRRSEKSGVLDTNITMKSKMYANVLKFPDSCYVKNSRFFGKLWANSKKFMKGFSKLKAWKKLQILCTYSKVSYILDAHIYYHHLAWKTFKSHLRLCDFPQPGVENIAIRSLCMHMRKRILLLFLFMKGYVLHWHSKPLPADLRPEL